MKLGQYVEHNKINFFIKKLSEKYGLETSPRTFFIVPELDLDRFR